MAKKIRPLGDITLDMEPLLFEMSIDHDMQHQEVMAQIYVWLITHVESKAAVYDKGGSPDVPKLLNFEEAFNERRQSERTKNSTPKSARVQQKRRKTKNRSK